MDYTDCSEDFLIREINAGNEHVFEFIFHKYFRSLCYFCNKFVKDSEVAQDIVQDIFIRFWEKKIKFDHIGSLRSFLYKSVQNKALNYTAVESNRFAILQQFPQEHTVIHDFFYKKIEAEMFEEIFAAIESLPEESRRIFQMSYIEHIKVKEIAKRLNIAESTVKTQQQRAKKYLKNYLRHLYPVVAFFFF